MDIKDLSVEAVEEVRGGRNILKDNDYNTQVGVILQGKVQGDSYGNTLQMNQEDNDKNVLFAPKAVSETSSWAIDFKNVSFDFGFPYAD